METSIQWREIWKINAEILDGISGDQWLFLKSIFACLSQFHKHICLLITNDISKININCRGKRIGWSKNKTKPTAMGVWMNS